VLGSAVVIGTLFAFEGAIVKPLIPALRKEVQLFAPEFSIESAEVVEENSNAVVRVQAYLSRPIRLEGKTLLPSGWLGIVPMHGYELQWPASDVLEYCAIEVIFVLAWPVGAIKEFLVRCGLAIPLAALLVLLDLPPAVIAELWNQVRSELDANGLSGWIILRGCLGNGGGVLLGCCMAGIAIGGAKRLDDSRNHWPISPASYARRQLP
jgi:hypothetical protein